MWNDLIKTDNQILISINNSGTPFQDAFWLFITNALNWIPFFALLLYIIFRFFPREKWKILIFTLLSLFTTVLITNTTKEIVRRIRPLNDELLLPYLRVITPQNGYSFFSGHTSNSFAICIFLFLVFRQKMRWSFWIFVWAIPYSYSRLYLGVHFPSDVLVGMIVGTSVAYIYFRLYNRKHT
ncbi:MAG: phosphatase PAP2 family protein [Capnocytophaga sp.]|nr:phosphatase PAP2 family protein [Capnocytophaga sp.]